jgi:hypothetical protein
MLKIDHPQVYIYSYQLSRESKAEVNSIWTWANDLWQHFSPELTPIPSKENLSDSLSEPKIFSHSNKIDGSFKFCCLDDSEGILARIGCPEIKENKDIEITELKQFNVNNLLLADSHENWLGQTILITYKSENYQQPNKNYFRKIADECLENIFPEASVCPPFYRATELFDSPMFEYSYPKGKLQVFVYLIDNNIEEKLGEIIQPLFELFYHRHKITQAFIDSRKVYEFLRKLYAEIDKTITNLETIITELTQIECPTEVNPQKSVNIDESLKYLKTKLKKILQESLDYERALKLLEDRNNTISIHVYGYQQKLSEIREICQLTTNNLTTFTFFIERNCPYFQEQINGDLGYFKHGTDLIKIAVELVRGIVDIEQAECDRSLEKTIQILGAGLGAGGIVSSAITNDIDKPLVIKIPQKGDRLHPGVTSLLFSLLAVIIVGGLVGWKNGKWKINGKFKLFKGKFDRPTLPDSQSQPVNHNLQEAENAIDRRNDG